MKTIQIAILAAFLAVTIPSPSSAAGPSVIDSYFRADAAFPNYVQFWENTKTNSGAEGGFVHVYVRNEGPERLRFEDASLDGVILGQAIAFSDQRKFRKHAYAASIHFSKLTQDQKDRLTAAGEPVWYRFEPAELGPGECGELTVRLRGKASNDVNASLTFSGGLSTEAGVSCKSSSPRFESIAYSPGRDTVYLYVAKSSSGQGPVKVLMDGKDITSDCVIGAAAGSLHPVVCRLSSPAARASFHCFQVGYANGEKATGAVRAYDDEFSYGMWGAAPSKSEDNALAEAYLRDLSDHCINTVMEQIGSEAVRSYMASDAGLKVMDSLGIRRMVSDIGKGGTRDPWAYFLMDEPDAGDSKVQGIPGGKLVGSLGQGLVDRSREMRQQDPVTPHLLNVDMTYKPQNWYTYAQLPDILTADPYYQNRLAETYSTHPEKRALYRKADFVAGVAEVCRSAQAPRQLNLVIFAGAASKGQTKPRFATPEEKRIESYYAIGAGCKGVSYWWFHSLAQGLPPRKADPVAVAQWREIGLVGAELGTLGPLIMTGCPSDIPVRTSSRLWSRALVRGDNTIVLVLVNDDYANDENGTTITPIKDAEVELTMPAGFSAKSVFSVSATGLADTDWKAENEGQLLLRLDGVGVTSAVVITRDPSLRQALQKRYDTMYSDKVKRLVAPQ